MGWTLTDGNLIQTGKVSTDMSSNITSSAIDIRGLYGYAVQVAWSGTPNGTIKLQTSIDNSTWTDLANSSYQISSGLISGASNFMWNVMTAHYKWCRFVWINTSGTGTLTVCMIHGKG